MPKFNSNQASDTHTKIPKYPQNDPAKTGTDLYMKLMSIK